MPEFIGSDSSQHEDVAYPSPTVSGLKVALPSLPSIGAKSRVETQIKVVLQVTMPDGDPLAGYRVGTWKYIKLEKGTALRKRRRNNAKNPTEPNPEEVLQLVATVHPASQPHLTAYRCASCHQREVKRMARKLALRVRPPPSPSPSPDGSDHSKNCDNVEEELDDKRMIVFNCTDLQELRDGEVSLPTRLVCYCRHHREKVGFIVVFQLFAEGGRLVAEGRSPPIMITDDHKTRNPTDSESLSALRQIGFVSAPEEAMSKRKTPTDDSAESQQEHRPRKKNRSAAPTPPEDMQWTSPTHMPMSLPLTPISALGANHALPTLPPIFPFPEALSGTMPLQQGPMPTSPKILRLVPPTGPVAGGIEVTLLGQAFSLTTAPVFGNVPATSWVPYGENVMVCILPPSPCPGPVRVTLQGVDPVLGEEPAIFCYEDQSDKALMELALLVVGMKMNGRMDTARDVAMQIILTGRSVGSEDSTMSDADGLPYGQSAYEVPRFAHASQAAGHDFQSTVMSLMRLLEAPLPSNSANAPYLSLTSPTGLTLLHLAVILNFHRLCGQLLSLGIDPDVRDVNGYTALHFAALRGRVRCARLLLDANADVSIVQGLGLTAADVARACDELDVLELCEEYAHTDNYDGVDADESAEDGLSDVSAGMSMENDDTSESEDIGLVLAPIRSDIRDATSTAASPSMLLPSTVACEIENLPPLPDDSDTDLLEQIEQNPNTAPPPYSYWPSTLVDYSAALLQKALLQLQTPQYATPWKKMPSVVPTVPWEKMAEQLHLPAMPFIFHVGVPSWPSSLTWPSGVPNQDGEKIASAAGRVQVGTTWWQRQDAGKSSKAEKADVRVGRPSLKSDALSAATTEIVSAPSKNARRVRYDEIDVTDGEINSFAYQASMVGRRVHRNDRMLVLFWIPILIIVLSWAVWQSLPYAYFALQVGSRAVSSRLIQI
ncbi:hypothetical protein CALVIDRAFT_540853 [Calocera viscosa TUFC12733]|uniref:IPT/TIG domain-containing protein n=1 Tax=Calocera viscosa (strain TUFC12733) TaxID=1330018 RepID=A0A167IF54_CALVF|nr:hypothetical protein CALVIDRAFT_540853 [Calocera viscosa TUFC12733]